MTDTRLILPKVEVAQRSDPGKDPDKQVNEDCARYGETPFGHLAVLCDGMGGHEGGREASNLAVESIFRHVMNAAARPDIPAAVRAREVLRDAVAFANAEVFGLSASRVETRPGSTVVAALLHPLGTEVAHVGDSRCYLVHQGAIHPVTRDHSKVQQLVDAGLLAAEHAAAHPESNMITRALGMSPTVDVEVQPSSVVHAANDTFILCSDGLSDLVAQAEVLRITLISPTPQAARELVDLANERGGHDNVTVLLVRALEAALPSFTETSSPIAPRVPVAALPMTENMPAADLPSGARLPGGAVPDSPDALSPPRGDVPDSHPLLPPAPSRRGAGKRRGSPVIVWAIGGVMVLVVLASVAIALWFRPDNARTSSVGPGSSIVLPAASLATPQTRPLAGEGDAQVYDATPRGRRLRNRPHR